MIIPYMTSISLRSGGIYDQSQNDESACFSSEIPNDLTAYNNLAYGATAILLPQ